MPQEGSDIPPIANTEGVTAVMHARIDALLVDYNAQALRDLQRMEVLRILAIRTAYNPGIIERIRNENTVNLLDLVPGFHGLDSEESGDSTGPPSLVSDSDDGQHRPPTATVSEMNAAFITAQAASLAQAYRHESNRLHEDDYDPPADTPEHEAMPTPRERVPPQPNEPEQFVIDVYGYPWLERYYIGATNFQIYTRLVALGLQATVDLRRTGALALTAGRATQSRHPDGLEYEFRLLPVSVVHRIALESIQQPPEPLTHTQLIIWLCSRSTVTPATMHYIRMQRYRGNGSLPHPRDYLHQEFASAWLTRTDNER